jgi:predicted ester cyclase
MRVTIEELIAERDLVAARFTGQGTHLGELFGTPPTGRTIVFNGIDVIRFRDGKAVEVWHQGDDMIGLMQLGIKLPIPSV